MSSTQQRTNQVLNGLENFIVNKFKSDFDVNVDLSEINFTKYDLKKYCDRKSTRSEFGEEECLVYELGFAVNHMDFSIKVLSFEYKNSHEVLKLDVKVVHKDSIVKKELEPCCNFLQRRRNLNLLFSTLIDFSRYIEGRRLLIHTVLHNIRGFSIQRNIEGRILIEYHENIHFKVYWKVSWNAEDCAHDVIEVYYKKMDVPNSGVIEEKLTELTHPKLSFHQKYRLWVSLISEISRYCTNKRPLAGNRDSVEEEIPLSEAQSIIIIDEDSVETDTSKRRRINNNVCSSSVYEIPD